ncbi:tigger transposable element-derived protein 2-like [Diachasma alloeum]|uniref:tigger transposable element-derived protein 2-like n=1 Tax=Diachasma alloeum TaxID=454923 RepID=UPI0007381ABB|nr:tigger transposable element-derived protein 2-like [Diachasma alloeum]
MKKEEKYRKWVEDHEDVLLSGKKRIKLPMHPLVYEAVWMWFKQHRIAGFPITGPILQIQALNFWKLFGATAEFKASPGWLEKWKVRHGIKRVILSGEKVSADEAGAAVYKEKFAKIVPRTSLNSASVTAAAGFKVQKERLTVMACCNASGTFKLPLVVIGKYAKFRALKNLSTLPVIYKNQKSAWMSAFLFEDWFKTQFVPEVEKFLASKGLPPKAILFVDNCSAHPPKVAVNEIRVEFLPPNTTPLIQPMDQGCLQNIKSLYKIRLKAFYHGAI